jgi:hypothetical protein
MGKASRRHLHPASEVASSDPPPINPNATLGPEASQDITGAGWKDRDSTNAPRVGQAEEPIETVASTAGLVDKILAGRIKFDLRIMLAALVLAWFIFLSWLFVQDNAAHDLSALPGLIWFLAKAAFYTGIFSFAVLVLRWVMKARVANV